MGTGGPEVLTIRFGHCELDALAGELCRLRAQMTERAAAAHRRADESDSPVTTAAVESHHQDLVELSRVLNQLDALDQADTEPVEVAGPAWFLAGVVRGAATSAVAGLAEAMDRFRDPDIG
jgi:hypothetical protein